MEETGFVGYRGTITFIIIVILSFVSLWLGFFTPDVTTSFLTGISLAYFGSKTADKVTDVVKERINVKKGQNSGSPESPV